MKDLPHKLVAMGSLTRVNLWSTIPDRTDGGNLKDRRHLIMALASVLLGLGAGYALVLGVGEPTDMERLHLTASVARSCVAAASISLLFLTITSA